MAERLGAVIEIGLLLMLCCVLLFYRAGRMEGSRSTGLLFAALSAGIWMGTGYWLGGGLPLLILGQIALFVGIGIYRVRKDGGFKTGN